MHVDGSCHCGAIKFSAEVDPARIGICHCTDCQVMSSAPFRTMTQVAAADFTLLQGTMKIYEKTGDSGNRRALAFCGDCSTQIYATNAEPPQDVLGIRVGTLAQRAEFKPSLQIWCQSRLPWLGKIEGTVEKDRQ